MFRTEAVIRHADRLNGDVAIVVPVGWQSIGYLIFGGVAAALAFLSFANYSRVEMVAGSITPDRGVLAIVPTRSGLITVLTIKEGQDVAAGTDLVSIRAEEDGAPGPSPAAQIEAAIARQDASLSMQAEAALSSARAQQAQLAAQRGGLVAEIGQIKSQISLQRDLIATAQQNYDRARTVAERGYISKQDLQVREEALLTRQQGLSQLTQLLATKEAAIVEAERSVAQIIAQAKVQSAGLSASRAEVAQQAASAAGARSYVLRAPIDGRVTALTARVGQSVNIQTPLMSIVPAGAILRAELVVPSAAIGFVKKGQDVRLAIDAFPYQRFGTVTGKVLTVATSTIGMQGTNGTNTPVYLAIVALDQSAIMAYGRKHELVSGMTLTARIVTEKQSLLEWLFEPLFAVRRR